MNAHHVSTLFLVLAMAPLIIKEWRDVIRMVLKRHGT